VPTLSGIAITQVFLFAVSLYIAIAASAIGETSAYYWFLSIAESALLLLIVWYAWTWPRRGQSYQPPPGPTPL
jgi:hypothetical protein